MATGESRPTTSTRSIRLRHGSSKSGRTVATAPEELERQRSALGFSQIGKANGMPIYWSTEKANASQSIDRMVKPNLALPTYQFLLPALASDASLRGKFNENGTTDYSFWIAGRGRDTNHLITDSQEAEITASQEAEAFKLAESGVKYEDIARKLGVPAVGVYYALKRGPKRKKGSKKPRTSTLCTFDKKGNLIAGKGDSLETTVRVSRGSDDGPLLFLVLRDSYSRIGGARCVVAACNGRQFTPDTMARVMVGVPQEATLKQMRTKSASAPSRAT